MTATAVRLSVEAESIRSAAHQEALNPPGRPKDGLLQPCDSAHLLIAVLLRSDLTVAKILRTHHVNLGDARFVTHAAVRESKVRVRGSGLNFTNTYHRALTLGSRLAERDQVARTTAAHLVGGIILAEGPLVRTILARAKVSQAAVLNQLFPMRADKTRLNWHGVR